MQKFTAKVRYSVSKARNTFGYNVVTLRSTFGGTFKTVGGGYDMLGTVFGDWLEKFLTQEQMKSAKEAGFYGVVISDGQYYLDGGCGISSMKKIAQHAGFTVNEICRKDKDGRLQETIGFELVCD